MHISDLGNITAEAYFVMINLFCFHSSRYRDRYANGNKHHESERMSEQKKIEMSLIKTNNGETPQWSINMCCAYVTVVNNPVCDTDV